MEELRQPVLICIDTSGSMRDAEKKETIEKLLATISSTCALTDEEKEAVDLCVLAFDDEVRTLVDWKPLFQCSETIELDTAGCTSLGSAVVTSIDKVKEKLEVYHTQDITGCQAQIFLFVDGYSTENMEKAYQYANAHLMEQQDIKMHIFMLPPLDDASDLLPLGKSVNILQVVSVSGIEKTEAYITGAIRKSIEKCKNRPLIVSVQGDFEAADNEIGFQATLDEVVYDPFLWEEQTWSTDLSDNSNEKTKSDSESPRPDGMSELLDAEWTWEIPDLIPSEEDEEWNWPPEWNIDGKTTDVSDSAPSKTRQYTSSHEEPPKSVGMYLPIVICIDTSESMNDLSDKGKKKYEIAQDMVNSLADLELSEYDRENTEICVLVFDDEVRTLVDWRSLASFHGGIELDAGGRTSLNDAILMSIEIARERRRVYSKLGIGGKQAQIFLYTDGESKDSIEAIMEKVASHLNCSNPGIKMHMILIPPAAAPKELLELDAISIYRAADCINGLPAGFDFDRVYVPCEYGVAVTDDSDWAIRIPSGEIYVTY